jgi:hypothetical protein
MTWPEEANGYSEMGMAVMANVSIMKMAWHQCHQL